MATSNKGAIFVRNYFSKEWKKDKTRDLPWTALPKEDNMSIVTVLYQCQSDLNNVFANLQLIFQIHFDDDHPYKAPEIIVLTPNGRMEPNAKICIHGLTARHHESWSIITSFPSVITRFMCAFMDITNTDLLSGAGFITPINQSSIAHYAKQSEQWNLKNYQELYDQFVVQQFIDDHEIAPTHAHAHASAVDHEITDADEKVEVEEYYYSD